MDGMIGVMLRGMGIDPQDVVSQALAVARGVQDVRDSLARIEANQQAVMTAMGLVPPSLDDAQAGIVADGVRRYLASIPAPSGEGERAA